MNNKITVYGKPRCVQCKMTIRYFDENQITYQYIDVLKDEKELNYIKDELGFNSLPVVTYKDMKFSGYRPNRLDKIIEDIK